MDTLADSAVTRGKVNHSSMGSRVNNGAAGTAPNYTVSGWAGVMATASSAISIPVTFGVTFSEPPIVIATYGGDKASGAIAWPSGVAVKRGYVSAHTITTTGCIITAYSSDGSNWSTSNSVYAQYVAKGAVA